MIRRPPRSTRTDTLFPYTTRFRSYGPALRAVATEAVKSVYSHGTGEPRDKQPYFRQREEKGRRFRVTYGCTACDGSDNLRGNVEHDFVGVFDTVAPLQNAAVIWLVRGVFADTLLLIAASIIFSWHGAWSLVFGLLTGAALIGYARTVKSQIRYFAQNPDTPLNLWDPRSWPRIIGNPHRAY